MPVDVLIEKILCAGHAVKDTIVSRCQAKYVGNAERSNRNRVRKVAQVYANQLTSR